MPKSYQRFQEWRDQQAGVNYPFADFATLTNGDNVSIPRSIFLDASVYAVGVTEPLHLSQIVITEQDVTLYLGTAQNAQVCSSRYRIANPPDTLFFEDRYGRACGVLVSESVKLALLQNWLPGEYFFNSRQTAFAASCCIPLPTNGVEGFILPDGTVVAGDVVFVAGNGLQFEIVGQSESISVGVCDYSPQANGLVVKLHAVGDPLFRRKSCDETFDQPRFVRRFVIVQGDKEINVEATDTQELQLLTGTGLVPDPALRVGVENNAVTFALLGETAAVE